MNVEKIPRQGSFCLARFAKMSFLWRSPSLTPAILAGSGGHRQGQARTGRFAGIDRARLAPGHQIFRARDADALRRGLPNTDAQQAKTLKSLILPANVQRLGGKYTDILAGYIVNIVLVRGVAIG